MRPEFDEKTEFLIKTGKIAYIGDEETTLEEDMEEDKPVHRLPEIII